MKITLIILGLIYLVIKFSAVKHLLESKESQRFRMKGLLDNLREKCEEANLDYSLFIGITWICTFVLLLIISLFMLLSSIYIGGFLFSILSILLIGTYWNGTFKQINSFYQNNELIYSRVTTKIIWFLAELSYIAFVFYNVYLGYGA